MAGKVRFAVVDDHPMFRAGVIHTLTQAGMESAAEGETPDDAIRIAREAMPDVLIIDVNMGSSSIPAVRQIAAECPSVRTMMLTVVADEEHVVAALRAGATGYMLKGVAGQELVESVRRVSRGEAYVYPALAAALIGHVAAGESPGSVCHADRARGADPCLSRQGAEQQGDRFAPRHQRQDGQALPDRPFAEAAGTQPRRGRSPRRHPRQRQRIRLAPVPLTTRKARPVRLGGAYPVSECRSACYRRLLRRGAFHRPSHLQGPRRRDHPSTPRSTSVRRRLGASARSR